MHVGKGRRNPLHVDYIFLGACLGYIQDSMTEAILFHPRLELTKKVAIVKAIGKVIWIQNDLMAKWHVEDGREFLDDSENERDMAAEALEPEGYVNGKRILGDGHSGKNSNGDDQSSIGSASSGKSTTSLGRSMEQVRMGNEQLQQSRCPFSGMVNGAGPDDLDKQRTATPVRPSRRELVQPEPAVPLPSSGIPRLHLIDGMTYGKEKLDQNPFM